MENNSRQNFEDIVGLDLKDRKILSAMDMDGRLNYSKLAKLAGVSKHAAEYRIKNLINNGIIKTVRPVFNFPKLGYRYCILMLTFQKMTEQKRKEILHYLVNYKEWIWVSNLYGAYDFLIGIWVKTLEEFKQFTQDIESRFGDSIKSRSENVVIKNIALQRNFLLGSHEKKEVYTKETGEIIKVDYLDKKIISLLLKDGRIPTTKISKIIRCDPKVVAYRIKKMEKLDIMKVYYTIFDYSKLGYTHFVILINLNKTPKSNLVRIKNYLRNNPHTTRSIEMVGSTFDIWIEFVAKTGKDMTDFIEGAKRKFPGVIEDYHALITTPVSP